MLKKNGSGIWGDILKENIRNGLLGKKNQNNTKNPFRFLQFIVATFLFNITETEVFALGDCSIPMAWNKILKNVSLANNVIYVQKPFKIKPAFQYWVKVYVWWWGCTILILWALKSCRNVTVVWIAFNFRGWEEFTTANMIWVSPSLAMLSCSAQKIDCSCWEWLLLHINTSFLCSFPESSTHLYIFHLQGSLILIALLRALGRSRWIYRVSRLKEKRLGMAHSCRFFSNY